MTRVPNTLVLGLGNALAGADAFGPAVIDWLRGAADLDPAVTLVQAHTDLLAHLDRFAAYDRVVLVDAVLAPAGDVPRHPVEVFAEEVFSLWDAGSRGVHELSPLLAVRLFRQLQQGAGGQAGPPVFSLVGHLVRAADFRRRPCATAIMAGAAAVRRLVAVQRSTPASSNSTVASAE